MPTMASTLRRKKTTKAARIAAWYHHSAVEEYKAKERKAMGKTAP